MNKNELKKRIKAEIKKYLNVPDVDIGIFNNRTAKEIACHLSEGSRTLSKKIEGEGETITVNLPGNDSFSVDEDSHSLTPVTVGDIFSRICSDTNFLELLNKSLYKKDIDVISRYLRSKRGDNDKKRLANGRLSAFLHSYLDYAKKYKPSRKTIEIKGHDLYMIATGTTFNSIKGDFSDVTV